MGLDRKFNFTVTSLKVRGKEENWPPKGKVARYFDTKEDYLILEVHPSGKMIFKYYRKLPGEQTPYRRNLCEFSAKMPQKSLDAARGRAKKLTVEIMEGGNPRQREKDEKAQITLAEWFEIYKAEKKDKNRSWSDDERKYKDHLRDALGKKKLSEITPEDVARVFNSVTTEQVVDSKRIGGKYAANRVLALIRSMLELARKRGRLLGPNVAVGVDMHPEEARERKLEPDEMGRFHKAVMKETNKDIRDIVHLALLTPARKMSILSMRWDKVFFERATWQIPKEKSKAKVLEHHALVAHALNILITRFIEQTDKSLENEFQKILAIEDPAKQAAANLKFRRKLDDLKSDVDQPFVFPASSSTGHRMDIKNPWNRIRRVAKVTDIRFHDLRRTNGSYQAALGASLHTIGGTLGHKSSSVTKVYARLNLDPLRASLESAAELMMKHAGVSKR